MENLKEELEHIEALLITAYSLKDFEIVFEANGEIRKIIDKLEVSNG